MRKCAACGEDFYVRPHRLTEKKYCSIKCYRPRVDDAEVARLHREGMTQKEIGRILGCRGSTVSRSLRRSGLTARKPTAYRTFPSADDVRGLYEGERLSQREVARKLGIARTTVTRIMRENGIRPRREGRPVGKVGPSFETDLNRVRPLLAERSAGQCEVACSPDCRGRATHAHHRKLRSQGGRNELPNLLHVCIVCHGIIHALGAEAYERGWLVRSHQDPEAVPIFAA